MNTWHRAPSWSLAIAAVVVFGLAWRLFDGFGAGTREFASVLIGGDKEAIRHYLLDSGAWGPTVSVAMLMLQVVLAPVPASVIQLTNGVVYGLFWGGALNLAGQTAGAMMAFSITRFLGKGTSQRVASEAGQSGFAPWLERWGGKALFITRAVPGMPSDVISYATGLTRMPVRTYLLATFLGFIPQSLMYAWLGDAATEWFWYIVVGGFALSLAVGLISWTVQTLNRRRLRQQSPSGFTTS